MSDSVEMPENTADQPNMEQIGSALPVSTGALLQAGRMQKNIEIDQVAQALKLSPRQILALERDDFQALPDPMITRGFIRNYARYLEIDAQPLLEYYRQSSPASAPPSLALDSVNISFGNRDKRFLLKYIVLSVLILIAGGAWMVYHDYWQSDVALKLQDTADTKASESSSRESSSRETLLTPHVEAQTPAPANVDLPEPALPIAERMANNENIASTQTQNAAAIEPANAGLPTQAMPKTAENAAKQTTTKAAQAHVTLKFSALSWVSVRDGEHREVFNKTMSPGTTAEIVGMEPLTLVIGNSSGTALVYAGKAVDLTPFTKFNVARLRLQGQDFQQAFE